MKINQIKQILKKFAYSHRQIFAAIAIISLAAIVVVILLMFRKPPQLLKSEKLAPLVTVRCLTARNIRMVIRGTGTVSPKTEVEIAPQLSGKVIYINENFRAGGFIPAGQTLLDIDPRDYELAVQQGQAGVAEAVVKLDIEKAEAQVALEEWKQLHPETKPASPLVLRQPQIRQAQARLQSAQAALAAAKLNLERTRLILPIDVRIVSQTVDLGQFVTTGKTIGRAYGMDFVEIALPLEDEQLKWFKIPDRADACDIEATSRTAAEVITDFAGTTHTWNGYVARMTGQVDIKSRLISVVIEIPQPFDTSKHTAPLLPGMFVEVLIKGDVLKNAIAVPRDAIHNGNEVWLVNNSAIHIQPLNIVRSDRDFAYTISDLQNEAIIVTSSLDVVTEGMVVRIGTDTDMPTSLIPSAAEPANQESR
jgi:RND family efflux transporter MFP subunit